MLFCCWQGNLACARPDVKGNSKAIQEQTARSAGSQLVFSGLPEEVRQAVSVPYLHTFALTTFAPSRR